MSDETKDEKLESQMDDLLHPSIGGKKVGQFVPMKSETADDFSALGGKCVLKPNDHPLFGPKHEELVKKEGDAQK